MKLLPEYKKYGAPSWFPRFLQKVNKNGPTQPHMSTPCWVWTAAKGSKGYGIFVVPGGHDRAAHRIAWRLAYGRIPAGKFVCHTCDNPSCVNVDHLFIGSRHENIQDAYEKGRMKPWGQPYDPQFPDVYNDVKDYLHYYNRLKHEEEE